jgi:hypothetical protein
VAVTVAVRLLFSVAVVALKLPVAAPAATVTEVGTVSAAWLLLKDTAAPPVGAGLESVTVQELDAFDPRLVGLHTTEETVAGVRRLIVALCEVPFRLAVTVAVPLMLMIPAVAMKVPVADPAVIRLADGMVRIGLLLASVITLQPEGTGLSKVMVHVLTRLEVKLVGLQVTDETARPGARLRVRFCELPFKVAVTIAV